MANSETEFAAFLAGMSRTEKQWSLDPWYVDRHLPSHDFNREIIHPGKDEKFPEGAVGIRSDWNFWAVAILPYRFHQLDCATIVRHAWPEISSPTIYPDDGDYWWEAIGNEDLEVPGEPWELWHLIRYTDGHSETKRHDTAATAEELLARENRAKWSMVEGSVCEYELRQWQDGQRHVRARHPVTNITYTPPREPQPL